MLSALRSAVSMRAGVAGEAHQVGPGGDLLPFGGKDVDGDSGVEMAKKGGGDRQAGDGDRIAAVHHPGEARIGGDDAFGGDVMAAAGQALAEVFGKGGGDEGGEVEAGEGEGGHARRFAGVRGLRNCFFTRRHEDVAHGAKPLQFSVEIAPIRGSKKRLRRKARHLRVFV